MTGAGKDGGADELDRAPPTPLDGPLPPGASRETQIRRDTLGRWYDGDVPITHPKLARAFDGWVSRAPDGRYCLSNSIHWVYVRIEGPAYFVESVREHDGALTLELSGGRRAPLDPSTLALGPDDGLYCRVFESGLPARFRNAAAVSIARFIDATPAGPRFSYGGASHILAREVEPA